MKIGELWRRWRGVGLGVHALETNGVLRLPGGPGVTVHVEQGQVVVTRADDLDDHVLEAGMAMDLAGSDRAMAWAVRPSRLEVRRLPARAAAAPEAAYPATGRRASA